MCSSLWCTEFDTDHVPRTWPGCSGETPLLCDSWHKRSAQNWRLYELGVCLVDLPRFPLGLPLGSTVVAASCWARFCYFLSHPGHSAQAHPSFPCPTYRQNRYLFPYIPEVPYHTLWASTGPCLPSWETSDSTHDDLAPALSLSSLDGVQRRKHFLTGKGGTVLGSGASSPVTGCWWIGWSETDSGALRLLSRANAGGQRRSPGTKCRLLEHPALRMCVNT